MTDLRRLERASALAFPAQMAALAGLMAAGTAAAAVAFLAGALVGALVVPPLSRRWPEATAMFAIGGLGMVLGWWADLGFRSAAEAAPHASAALDTIWCRSPLGGETGSGHLLSSMNAGMLAFGVPASALAHRARAGTHEPGSVFSCALAMVAGMTAGSFVASRLALSLDPAPAVLVDWAGMTIGMLAGMIAAQAALRRLGARSPRAVARSLS